MRRLVWSWSESTTYSVAATTDEPGATVTASKSEAQPGENVSFSAVAPAGRAFWKWTGDVPAEHVYDSAFEMAVNSSVALEAHFADFAELTPADDLAFVITNAPMGSVVTLAAGEYGISRGVALPAEVRVYGAGRDETCIKLTGTLAADEYVLTLANARSCVTGVTLTAASKNVSCNVRGALLMSAGTFSDSRISGFYNVNSGGMTFAQGLGVCMSGGSLLRTEVSGNEISTSGASHAGPAGVYITGGLVEDCTVVSNLVNYTTDVSGHGCGLRIEGGRVSRTLVAWNTDTLRTSGLAALGGTVADCTIVSNTSTRAEGWGGVYCAGATFTNCVICGNNNIMASYDVRRGPGASFVDCTIGTASSAAAITRTVSSVEDLVSAAAEAGDGSVITLLPGSYVLGKRIVMSRAIAIVGYGNGGNVYVGMNANLPAFVLRNPGAVVANMTFADQAYTPVEIIDGGCVSNCVFSGNTARQLQTGMIAGGGGIRMFASGKVVDCTFSRNAVSLGISSDYHGGAIYYEGSEGIVERCSFLGNRVVSTASSAAGTQRYRRGSALYVQGAISLSDCLFAGNTFVNTCGAGALAFLNTGKWVGTSVRSTMVNCTVADNTTTVAKSLSAFADETVAGVTVCDNGRVRAVNCIFDGNTDCNGATNNIYVASGTSSMSAMFSCIDAESPIAGGVGNVTAGPQFKNRAEGVYRLAAASPCRNAGTNSVEALAVQIDLAKKPRLAEGRIDMGAYEYQPPSGAVILFR